MELAIVEKDDTRETREEVDRNSRLRRGNTAPDAICKEVVRWGGVEKRGGQKQRGKKCHKLRTGSTLVSYDHTVFVSVQNVANSHNPTQ